MFVFGFGNNGMKKLSFLIFWITAQASAQGTIRPFELHHVADGKSVAVKNCSGCVGAVVIFTSVKCPYDQLYHDRIKALNEKFSSKISFFLINASPGADEDEASMKGAYSNWATNIPYLSDKKQLALQTLGATRTSEAFLLKPDGNEMKVVFRGPIDDNPQVHHDTGKDYLHHAIEELLAGKPITIPNERVAGCIIRKN